MQALLTPGSIARDLLASSLVSKAPMLLVLSTDGVATGAAVSLSSETGVFLYKLKLPQHCCSPVWSASAGFWRGSP